MTKGSFKALIERAKARDSYWAGKAIHDFTEELVGLMELRGINKAELARRIGSSPAYVTKMLRGDTNFTIESMIRIVRALDGDLSLHVTRKEDDVRWYGVVSQRVRSTQPREDEYHAISEHKVTAHTPWKGQVSHEPYTATA